MLRPRYRRIVWFFAQVATGLIVWELVLPRLGLRAWARRTRPDRLRRIAVRFRALAIRMGGVLIKVGQFLSSRLDVLPEEITSELAGLQDEVPPEDFDDIRRLAEAELGGPLGARFHSFDPVPLAAASLGQVHRALLAPAGAATGPETLREVVVKVQRPNVESLIATDLAAIRTVGGWLRRYPPIRRRADVPALLAEFTRILYEEIDYLAEGRNAETFAAHFQGDPGVRVPRVAWTHTTRRVLTLEDVYAIKITDYDAITAAGIDRAAVAERLFQTYLRQIFEFGFFHADPHPGNLFVAPGPPAEAGPDGAQPPREWVLTFVDFGMVGRVSPDLRAGLRELFIAIGTRDAARMVKGYQQLGILLPHADLALIEQMEARVFERFWGKTMAELRQIGLAEMREFAREFRGLVYTLPFQIPEDLILLGRTFAILSGMCTGLDPQFNLWEQVAPFARKLIEAEAISGWEFWLDEAAQWLHTLAALPSRMEAALGKIERGEVAVNVPRVAEQVSRLELSLRRLTGTLVFTTLLVSGVQLYVAGHAALGGVFMAGALLALAWVALL